MGVRSRSVGAVVGIVGLVAPALAGAGPGTGGPAGGLPAAALEVPSCHAAPEPAAAATAAGPAKAADATETRVTLADVSLVDRTGRSVRFPGEVLGDGIAVVNFVFTSCTTVCPVLSGLFGSVQERLGEKAGRSVRLISLSVDPVRDTPARLAAMAERYRAREGWSWLTGDREDMARVLRGLGAYVASPADHAPMVLVGDVKTGRWYRLNGFPSAAAIEERVNRLLAARTAGAEVAR